MLNRSFVLIISAFWSLCISFGCRSLDTKQDGSELSGSNDSRLRIEGTCSVLHGQNQTSTFTISSNGATHKVMFSKEPGTASVLLAGFENAEVTRSADGRGFFLEGADDGSAGIMTFQKIEGGFSGRVQFPDKAPAGAGLNGSGSTYPLLCKGVIANSDAETAESVTEMFEKSPTHGAHAANKIVCRMVSSNNQPYLMFSISFKEKGLVNVGYLSFADCSQSMDEGIQVAFKPFENFENAAVVYRKKGLMIFGPNDGMGGWLHLGPGTSPGKFRGGIHFPQSSNIDGLSGDHRNESLICDGAVEGAPLAVPRPTYFGSIEETFGEEHAACFEDSGFFDLDDLTAENLREKISAHFEKPLRSSLALTLVASPQSLKNVFDSLAGVSGQASGQRAQAVWGMILKEQAQIYRLGAVDDKGRYAVAGFVVLSKDGKKGLTFFARTSI